MLKIITEMFNIIPNFLNNLDKWWDLWSGKFWDSFFYFLDTVIQNYLWAWHTHFEWWILVHLCLIFWLIMRRCK